MTKQKLFKHVLTVFLTALLLLSTLPMSVFAQDESTDEAASKIVREVVELREESVKHFLCEDGSYIAVSYAEPVHYEKNGEWLEIDNTLVLSGKNTYVPKSSDVAVSIPQSFSGGKQITATNDGHTISFGVASGNENVALTKTAAVKAVEALPSSIAADVSVETLSNAQLSATATVGKIDTVTQIEAYNSEKTTVDNQAGALVYDKIFPNADLEYIVTGNSIKENVVVYQPQTEYVYTFDMDFGGLTPVAEEDGSYRLIDSAKPDETVFVLAAPYMYDANGEESYEIEMSLAENGDNYLLTLTADEEWINSSERAFPVVIDPTITLPNDEVDYNFNDVFVIDGVLDDSTKDGIELRAGRNLANLTRTYLKPDIPSLPTGAVIDNAQLILQKKTFFNVTSADSMEIYIFDCYGMPSWNPETITWNNQPYSQANNGYPADEELSSCIVNSATESCAFNITSAAKRWLSTGTNSGLMLASATESQKMQVDFFSSRAWLFQSKRPQMIYEYLLPDVDITQVTFDNPQAATSSPIKITTSEDWSITVDQPWVSVSATSGTGSSEFTISVTENTSANQRTGCVTVWMGSDILGTIEVEQSGSGAYLFLDKDTFFIDYKTCSKTVTVDTNDETLDIALELWNNSDNAFELVDIDENNADETAWLKVEKNTGEIDLTVRNENTEAFARKARITVTAQSDTNTVTKTIHITQYDKVTCLFNTINEDGTLSAISSTEYNHALATWSMELSYAAYNPVEYEAIPGIPSSFMQAPYDVKTRTAEFELESVGLTATPYNYDGEYWGYAAHTIGHRDIVIGNKQEKGEDNNDSSINLTNVHSTSGMVDANISGAQTDSGKFLRNAIQSGEIVSEIDESASRTSDNGRTLIVVSIRGSVTPLDWAMDLASQFDIEGKNFEAGCREIMESLEAYKISYKNEINNPIILVTGHSLGAAIANLVANELNAGISSDDVYAYTFATPNTVNLAGGKQAILYENVFNILNNNDAVPHFPVDQFGTEWARHGRDFHFTMPLVTQGIELFDIDLLGAFGHGMPNYYSWLNNLPGTLGKLAEDITVSDLEERSVDFAVGLGALLFKILCPVSVTLYDTDGNIVAYESQQEGATYPEITDKGIISWIADDGGKMFLIPYGTEDIEARIEAYDYGTMTLTVEQPGIGEPIDSITYNNVNLYPEKEFKVEIAEEFDSDNVALMQVETDPDGNEFETEITDLNPLLKSVTVQNPIVSYGTHTVIQVVTDKSVSKVQFIHDISGATITCAKDSALVVSVVEDGDNLIWTIQRVFTRGTHVYDVAVKVGYTWYRTENVFEITIN